MKKLKIKNKKKAKIIAVISFLGTALIAGVCVLVGGYFAGWDIIGGLTSKEAFLGYAIAGVIIFGCIGLLIKWHYYKEGDE